MLTEVQSTGAPPISLDEAMQELRQTGRHAQALTLRHTNRAILYVEREAQITIRPSVQYKVTLPAWPTYGGDDSYGGYSGDGYGRAFGANGSRRFPSDANRVGSPIRLPRPPWQSTDSVKYFDADNVEQTVASSEYVTRGSDTASATLEFDENYVFPTLRERSDAVAITFTAGTTEPDSLAISAALLMLHFFVDHDRDAKAEADRFISSLRIGGGAS